MTNPIEGEASDLLDGADAHCIAAAPDDLATRGIVSRIASAGRRFVVRVLDRIVNGIRGIAPLVLSLACQSTNDAGSASAPIALKAPEPEKPADTGPRPLGQFSITFYYVVGEDEVGPKPLAVASNENRADDDPRTELAAISSDRVTLFSGGGRCDPIAEVSKAFAAQLALQGTGKLRDGRVVNIFGACNCKRSPCFKVTQAQWGTGGTGKPLQPFRTMAVDPKVVKLGSLLYVPLLEGRLMPGRLPWGGYVHDGCVVAEDTGGHIKGSRLDLFVGRKAYFLGLGRSGSGTSHAWARHVPVFDGTGICEQKGRQITRRAVSI